MRRHFIKKWMVLLGIAASVGLSGCAKEEKKTSSFEPKLDTEAKAVLSTAGFFGNFEALDQVIADFNEYYPNIEFTYEQISIDNFDSYIDANPNIDVMMTSEEIFAKYGDSVNSKCADLEKEGVSLDAIEPSMLRRGYHDGKLSCIPMGQNIYGLIVNLSILEKEGLKVPNNYEEFIAVLTALKEKGYIPIQGPNSKVYAELTQNMAYDLILNDETLYKDLLAGKEDAAEKLQPVYDKLDEMMEKGFFDSSVNETYPKDNYDQAILNFFEGDVPFWVCNTEKVSGMKKRESKSEAFQKNPFAYEYIYAPLGENGAYAYREPWFGFSVNKNAENYDYAVEFVRFLATKDEINTMAEIKGIPSVAVESTTADIYKNVLNPEQAELNGVNEGTITAEIEKNWTDCVNEYVSGEYATSREALEAFVKRCSQ